MDMFSGESVNAVVQSTKNILAGSSKSNKINLFGNGNRKRDIELLLRGDIIVPVPVQASMFVCRSCGHISTIVRLHCINCSGKDIYLIEGIWKGTVAFIKNTSRSAENICEYDNNSNGYRIRKI